jgi:hypothetical protein
MPMHKKHWIKCPDCNVRLERISAVIQAHYRNAHNKVILEAEAYKIASPQKKRKVPYTEGVGKNYKEISGGLPSLGKRK